MLIDEVHLLNETRGSVLEAGVVSRVRVVSKLAAMQQVGVVRGFWFVDQLGHGVLRVILLRLACVHVGPI